MKRPALMLICPWLLLAAGPALTLDLVFSGPAQATGIRAEPLTSYRMPIGPFADGAVPGKQTEGPFDQRAWRIAAPGLTTLQLLVPLRDQLARAGFAMLFECEAVVCGGFDFRYATEVLPEPDMHVDLGDFRYLAAERMTPQGPEYISLIVSRTVGQGFVQMVRVGDLAVPGPDLTTSTKSPLAPDVPQATLPAAPVARAALPVSDATAPFPNADVGTLAERLATGGSQVLPDLAFASGDAALASGDYASLAALADYLRANPQARVMLVGHTDASGSLAANIVLSRDRARSVRARLLNGFDIPADRVSAEGAGYLSPRAPNDTDAGRLANRRVEVVLLLGK